jgi:transcriptional regulator with XRE-family HTH domain
MYRPKLETTIAAAALLVITGLSGSATTSTYELPRSFERTVAGPAGHIEQLPTDSTAEAILEIRRRSGLTWEELGDLFDVSRRSVHHWASGKSVSAKHDQAIRRILAAIRHLDQESQANTRALLLAINNATGVSTFDLLKEGRFDDAMAGVIGVRAPEYSRVPLSSNARDTRRPQPPMFLLEAEQERPVLPAKARVGRAVRAPKKKS